MSFYDWTQILIYAALLMALTPSFGSYIAKVFQGKKTIFSPALEWLELLSYRIGNINPHQEMTVKEYGKALFFFNLFGFIFLFLLLILQNHFPLNPQKFPGVPWDLAFNTAMSFVTNTNWQPYSGETTLSYLSQMLGLTVQNFLSAGTGFAALMALIRGISRRSMETIGNFWQDLVRSIVYILLPLSILIAIFLVSEGALQTLSSYTEVKTLEGGRQVIPMGPVASQIAIKQLGTNGGGFFNANSAHPFENPSPLTNLVEMLSIVLIPAALTYTFGIFIGSKKHGWLLFFVMFLIWGGGLIISLFSEYIRDPLLNSYPLLEGVETRFGIPNSLLWSTVTTATANGSVNVMISSLSPLAGGVSLLNIMLGEVIFGGIGVGLLGMIMFVLLTVFLSGIMVGRTPEYFGKKIEKREIQWVMVPILAPGVLILIGAGISSVLPFALSSLGNKGPHGLTEILYAFTSAQGNNGSSFAGLNANTLYYNLFLGVIMFLGRMTIILPSLAIADLLVKKKMTPPSLGTFTTDNFLFAILLFSIILIIGALTFFPALSLGPFMEHLLMLEGKSF